MHEQRGIKLPQIYNLTSELNRFNDINVHIITLGTYEGCTGVKFTFTAWHT